MTPHEKLLALIDRDIAVCEAASGGPWHNSDAMLYGPGGADILKTAYFYDDQADGSFEREADAAFCSRARTLLPATLKAIRDAVSGHPPESNDCRCPACAGAAPWCAAGCGGGGPWPCPTWTALSAPWSEEVERG